MSNSENIAKPFYAKNLEDLTKSNDDYRKVIYTGKNQQIVLMCLQPNDFIHMETHPDTDQFIRVETGEGRAIINNVSYDLVDGTGLIIPAGLTHKIINTSQTGKLRLYTIYSPPEHSDGLVQLFNPDVLSKVSEQNNFVSESDEFKKKYLKYKFKYLKTKIMFQNKNNVSKQK